MGGNDDLSHMLHGCSWMTQADRENSQVIQYEHLCSKSLTRR